MTVLEEQLREIYGRTVYTHKTHETCADILMKKHHWLKLTSFILSAMTTAGFIGVLITDEKLISIVGVCMATTLLALNAYTKDFDLGELALKHRESASKIWLMREGLLSLLTDLNSPKTSEDKIRKKRDEILDKLSAIYKTAPRTTSKAYKEAQIKLKIKEDMTFTAAEIDTFLPPTLKRQ